ncbi:unnamed protein product [Caenorhabditis nigoni]
MSEMAEKSKTEKPEMPEKQKTEMPEMTEKQKIERPEKPKTEDPRVFKTSSREVRKRCIQAENMEGNPRFEIEVVSEKSEENQPRKASEAKEIQEDSSKIEGSIGIQKVEGQDRDLEGEKPTSVPRSGAKEQRGRCFTFSRGGMSREEREKGAEPILPSSGRPPRGRRISLE